MTAPRPAVPKSIRNTVLYPHPPERVWRALTDRDALAEWLMPNDFEPVVGHRFRFRTDPAPGFDGIVHCEVLELDAPRRLAFSWSGGPIDTVVRFELEPVPLEGATGTRLSFEQTGFLGLQGFLVARILKRGFGKMHRELLPAVLDRLAREEDPTGAALPAPAAVLACKGPWTRLLGHLSHLVGRRPAGSRR